MACARENCTEKVHDFARREKPQFYQMGVGQRFRSKAKEKKLVDCRMPDA
jgi:hypothetical protein